MSQQLCVSLDRSTKNRLDAAGPSRSAAARRAIHAGLPLAEAFGGPTVKLVLCGSWFSGDGDVEWTTLPIDMPLKLAKAIVAYAKDLREARKRYDAFADDWSAATKIMDILGDDDFGSSRRSDLSGDVWDKAMVLGRAVDLLERAVYGATRQEPHCFWDGLESISIAGEPIAETNNV